jgi:hypothetical protein
MRFIYFAVGMAIAVLFVVPVVLTGAPAHADYSGYSLCVGKIAQIPLEDHDPYNLQLVGEIEQHLDSGVPPAQEAQKVAQKGFDMRVANGIVQCVVQERP